MFVAILLVATSRMLVVPPSSSFSQETRSVLIIRAKEPSDSRDGGLLRIGRLSSLQDMCAVRAEKLATLAWYWIDTCYGVLLCILCHLVPSTAFCVKRHPVWMFVMEHVVLIIVI